MWEGNDFSSTGGGAGNSEKRLGLFFQSAVEDSCEKDPEGRKQKMICSPQAGRREKICSAWFFKEARSVQRMEDSDFSSLHSF